MRFQALRRMLRLPKTTPSRQTISPLWKLVKDEIFEDK